MTALYTYRAELVRVVDGDTLDLRVDLGFRMYTIDRFRLEGVDTPEVYGVKRDSLEYRKGKAASAYTKWWLNEHSDDGHVMVRTSKSGKYGRWIATVFRGFRCLNYDLEEWLKKQEEEGWPALEEG